jgi:alpha-galactosidase
MNSNRAYEDFYRTHPDWFAVDAAGKPYRAGDLNISCVYRTNEAISFRTPSFITINL